MKIGIVSLGLIGGSIFKCLAAKQLNVIGITQNINTLNYAKKYNLQIFNNLQLLKDSDIVFVCSPISQTLKTLDTLENIVSKNCIVTDVASLKSFVMQKERPYKFIGSHPMAGTEHSGFDYSSKDLFINAKWALTLFKNSSEADIDILSDLIKKMGANPIIIDPQDHDFACALISHMPLILSQALFLTGSENNLALTLASSGFRDMTRLSMTTPNLASDMLNFNKDNILNSLKLLNKNIEYLINNPDYLSIIQPIINNRLNMYDQDGKNKLLF